MATRTPLMAGNWKMNLNHVEAAGLVQKLAWTLADAKYDPAKSAAAVIVPFTDLRTVQTLIEGDKLPLQFGAQDVSVHASGAYTGEISADMLAKLNCDYVVVGHSERRDYHAETDEIVNEKAKVVIAAGITPIVCVGEKLDVRKAGEQVPFVLAQVDKVLAGLTPEQVGAAIRARVAELFGQEAADKVLIQYGGSVKSSNVVDIMAQPDVDGALVGGASLDAEEFAKIVLFYAA